MDPISQSNYPKPRPITTLSANLLTSQPQTSASNPSAETRAPTNRDLLSEAELGLQWLHRRAELIRLEIQAIELELALQQARTGETESLLSWLKKNGTPWQEHLPNSSAAPAQHSATLTPAASPALSITASSPAPNPVSANCDTANCDKQGEPVSSPPALTPSPKPRSQKKPYPNSPKTSNSTSTPKSSSSGEPKPLAAKPNPATPKNKHLSDSALATAVSQPISKPHEPPHSVRKTKQIPSWLVSTLVHVALLILLMLFTIPLPETKQTLGLSGTIEPLQATPLTLDQTAAIDSNALENQELTAAVPESVSLESTLQNSLPSASDIANNSLAGAEMAASLSQPAADGLGGIADALDSKFIDSLSATSSLAAANFFGLEATGNVFCFVVDCSGSMRGEPFVATKHELLKTISQLKANQRFCVFFFNQKLFPMSLDEETNGTATAATEEFRPVAAYATPENISRLQRWMETIPIGTGGPPNQALKLAIELNPDSIFLLTDGVTRSDVAGNLWKTNRQEDELDGPQIRCPIHTIGFYSREGEALLQRIATENGGQYRYVPNPQTPKKSRKM